MIVLIDVEYVETSLLHQKHLYQNSLMDIKYKK